MLIPGFLVRAPAALGPLCNLSLSCLVVLTLGIACTDDTSSEDKSSVSGEQDGGEQDDDSNQNDDSNPDDGLDAGDECPEGWQPASYYTEPGCDPAPATRRVCAPEQWDAGCLQVCGCDGQTHCAAVFGNSSEWEYGLAQPYSDADPFLDCEAPSADDDSIDDGITDDAPQDTPDGGDGGPTLDVSDAGDGGPTLDPPEGDAPFPVVDSGLDCPSGWYEAELYTEQDCSSSAATTRVCVPESWDAGCQLTCGCDGQTYCGAVWGSGQAWNYGLHVPFTSCETDGGEITPL